jgi:putative N6-adenine-specific DNA methylase
MIACTINRKEFARYVNDWDNELFDNITDSLLKKVREFHCYIKGLTKQSPAVSKAKETISRMSLDEYISI